MYETFSQGQQPTSAAPSEFTGGSIPLHELPSFRRDLLVRSVFVLGLRMPEEMRELLSLMKKHCGIVTAAFRAAEAIGGPVNVPGAVVKSCSALSSAGGCVVVCLVFRTEEGAQLAQRLDNTALVYGSRFVVLPASRFQCDLSRSSVQREGFVPQHERLWQLLFSPTLGVSNIDWAAAAGAVSRGELLTLHPSELAAAVTNAGKDANSNVGAAYAQTAIGGRSYNIGCDGKSGGSLQAGADAVGCAKNRATTLAGAVAGSQYVPTAIDTQNLGRSNTLQQQYYNNMYGHSRTSFMSAVSDIASSIRMPVGGGSTDPVPSMNYHPQHINSYGPPPLRQRVESVGGHPQAAANDSNQQPADGVTVRSAYIPRMHSLGSLVLDALPFASALISPLLRVVSSQHFVGNRVADYDTGDEGGAEEFSVSEMLGIGDQRELKGRKRVRTDENARGTPVGYLSSVEDGEVENSEDDKLCYFEGGFTTLHPQVLDKRFIPPSMAAVPRSDEGGEARSSGTEDVRRSLLRAMLSVASPLAQTTSGTTNDGTGTETVGWSGQPVTPLPFNASNEQVREYVMTNIRLLPTGTQRHRRSRGQGTTIGTVWNTPTASTTESSQHSLLSNPLVSAVSSWVRWVSSAWRG